MPAPNSYRRLASLALGAALICSAMPAAAKTRPDNLVPAGDPVDCVQIISIRSSDVRDDQTIDFKMNGGKIYRNTLPYSCPGLGFEKRFAYATSLSKLCSVDIITVLLGSGPDLQRGASCGLGKFQPMQKTSK